MIDDKDINQQHQAPPSILKWLWANQIRPASLVTMGCLGCFFERIPAGCASPALAIDLAVSKPICSLATDSNQTHPPKPNRKGGAKILLCPAFSRNQNP